VRDLRINMYFDLISPRARCMYLHIYILTCKLFTHSAPGKTFEAISVVPNLEF
jgi:hypothetical protein